MCSEKYKNYYYSSSSFREKEYNVPLLSFNNKMNKYQMELTNGEDINQYPYVNTISCKVEEKDEVDIIYQYALDCSLKKIYHCTKDICGKPTKFPNYGNFSDIFTMVYIFPSIICFYPIENNRTLTLGFKTYSEHIFIDKCKYLVYNSPYIIESQK